jgi:translation initiation factor IF-2
MRVLSIRSKLTWVVSHAVTVAELAEIIGEKPVAVIKFLMADLGVMAGMTQNLDQATCLAVIEGFGKIVGDESEDWDDE